MTKAIMLPIRKEPMKMKQKNHREEKKALAVKEWKLMMVRYRTMVTASLKIDSPKI